MKRKVAVIILLGITVMFFFQVRRINKSYAATKIEQYNKKDIVKSNGIEITINKYEMLVPKEVKKRYKNFKNDFPDNDYRVVMLDIIYKNTTKETKVVDVFGYYLETCGWTNGVMLELFDVVNKDKEVSFKTKPGEKIEIKVPFIMYDMQFQEKTWENIDKEKFDYAISLYPIKRYIRVN